MRNPSEIWKKRTFLFMTSQAISLFGSSLVSYAILWRITLDTKSGAMMTLYLLFGFFPTFFLSPFAGVWADRYDRKRLIMFSDGAIALVTLLLAVFFLTGIQSLWLLFVIPLFRALGSAVQTPAVNSFLPQLVPEDKLMKANGLFTSMNSAISLVSPMVSGALMSFAPLPVVLMIDVVTALAAIIVMLNLKVPAQAKAGDVEDKKYWQNLAAGIRYIRHHEYLGRFFIFITFLYFLVTPVAILTPLQVTRSFGGDIWRLTAIEVVFSVGMLGGGLLIAAWGGFRNRMHMMAFATLIIGATTLLLGVVQNFWIYLFIMAIVGITLPLFNTPATVLLQEKVDSSYLGRVFGVMGMIASGVMPVAMLAFGPLADAVSIEWLLVVTGVMLAILALLLTRNKALLLAGEPVQAAHVEGQLIQTGRRLPECPAGRTDCQL